MDVCRKKMPFYCEERNPNVCPYHTSLINEQRILAEKREEEKSGMNHEANKCPCKNKLKKYIRNGKEVWLCSCCC